MKDVFAEFDRQRLTEEHLLAEFDCGEADLNAFLVEDALQNQRIQISTTYVWVKPESQLALAYITLCTDSIKLTSQERDQESIAASYQEFGAIKIARLGVHSELRRRGVGARLVEYAVGKALDVADLVGCRFVTLDALPHLVHWYSSMGFEQNQSSKYIKRTDQVSMRLDLLESQI